MKPIVFLPLITILCFFSCSERKHNQGVTISISEIRTNYFINDSIQQIAGYYPVKIYILLSINNELNDTVFFPVRNRADTLIQSNIRVLCNDKPVDKIDIFSGSKIIAPYDSSQMVLAITLLNREQTNMLPILNSFIQNISLNYEIIKSDSTHSKHLLPDSVILNINNGIILNYRDMDTFGTEIDWI